MVAARVVGKPAQQRYQVWFDPELGLMRVRGCFSNRCFPAQVNSCVPGCRSATSALLFYRYWPVDTTKFVRRPGIGTFHGRKVIWLGRIQPFPPTWGNGEWIAVDARTHDAVAWRAFATTTKPVGPVLDEFWIAKRFPNIPSNRFWFALRNPSRVSQVVRFEPLALETPGGSAPRDLRGAQVVGRIGGASIFAVPRRNGFWTMFSVDAHGKVGGGPSRMNAPHAIGVVQVGRGSLFSSSAYLVVAGNALEQTGAKLFLTYPGGIREPIKPLLVGRPPGAAGFYYYEVPKVARNGRATGLELVRDSRVVVRESLPLPYQRGEQPGVAQLRAAQHVLSRLVPPNHG